MERRNGDSTLVEGRAAFTQVRSPDEVLEARRNGDARKYVPAAKRLLRVLVADDDRDTADSMCILVKRWGHDVRVAYDGVAALEMASAFQPDVLLLDVAMPKVNGFQVALQLRRQRRFKETLLIALTGYADEAHRLLWQEAFDHYLIKPVEPSTVEKLLLLQQSRLEVPKTPPTTPRTNGVLVVDDEISRMDRLHAEQLSGCLSAPGV